MTLNYRIGLFGFLPTVIEGSRRGNYGLMDVMAALHWVQDNVAAVGGDAGNVTLAGHDRGAVIAHLLMLSPMARGESASPSPASAFVPSSLLHVHASQGDRARVILDGRREREREIEGREKEARDGSDRLTDGSLVK